MKKRPASSTTRRPASNNPQRGAARRPGPRELAVVRAIGSVRNLDGGERNMTTSIDPASKDVRCLDSATEVVEARTAS
jgi:hypothetical protein